MEPEKFSESAIASQKRDQKKTSSVHDKSSANAKAHGNISGVEAEYSHSVHNDIEEQISPAFEEDPEPPAPKKDEGSREFET